MKLYDTSTQKPINRSSLQAASRVTQRFRFGSSFCSITAIAASRGSEGGRGRQSQQHHDSRARDSCPILRTSAVYLRRSHRCFHRGVSKKKLKLSVPQGVPEIRPTTSICAIWTFDQTETQADHYGGLLRTHCRGPRALTSLSLLCICISSFSSSFAAALSDICAVHPSTCYHVWLATFT